MKKVNHKVFHSNAFMYLFIIFCYSTEIDSAKILAYFPIPSISHQVVFRPLTKELANRGHEVTVVTTDPAFGKGKTPNNLVEIDVHDISYKVMREKILKLFHGSIHEMMVFAYIILNELFLAQMVTDEIQNMLNIKNTTFDLVLTEAGVETSMVLGHIYKVPVIQISTLGEHYNNHDTIGAPTDALIYNQIFRKRIYNLSFLEKVIEYYNYFIIMRNFEHVENMSNQMLKQAFGPGAPSIGELKNNVAMLFLNIHPLWDIRPVPFASAYIGGLQLTHRKEDVPKDIKTFLDTSVEGVVYVSFGSNIQLSTLPTDKIKIFLKVFAQLPYKILLKCDLDILEEMSPNIKLSKWLPQVHILKHHNVKLFVNQGGLQSTEESISGAVPMVGIPFNGDQDLNTEHYVHYGIGIRLNMELITEETFKNAILTIATNKSYHHNILKLRSLMNDQPQSSLARAVWWTEHVLRHGGAQHLRAPAANMPWADQLELSLVFTVVIGTLVFTSLIIYITYVLLTRLLQICCY